MFGRSEHNGQLDVYGQPRLNQLTGRRYLSRVISLAKYYHVPLFRVGVLSYISYDDPNLPSTRLKIK